MYIYREKPSKEVEGILNQKNTFGYKPGAAFTFWPEEKGCCAEETKNMNTGKSLFGAMSWFWNNHGLPFLPGNTFRDVTKSAFPRAQTLHYKNGFPLTCCPSVGIGQDPLLSEQLIQEEVNKLTFETQDVRFESLYQIPPQDFVQAYVALDKKVLRFYAYFQEGVLFSPDEVYRVRPVTIYDYLEQRSLTGGPRSESGPRSRPVRTQTHSQNRRL